MRWAEITIKSDHDAVDAASNLLVDNGCAGTVIGNPTTTDEGLLVTGYLPDDDLLEGRLTALGNSLLSFPGCGLCATVPNIAVTYVVDDDWATAWKKHFKPFKIGRIVVKPTWENYEANDDDIILEIDPGMAFGTGTHPTTRLCILALQDYITGGERVLDVGTGSGILSMASVLLGASDAICTDTDSIAIDAANANFSTMGLSNRISAFRVDMPDPKWGLFDLVVANITANVLLDISESIAASAANGATIILSGIVEDRIDDLMASMQEVGTKLIECRRDSDWAALILKRER